MAYALISVTDKVGIVEFARWLEDNGWEILSSGGTAQTLREGGVAAHDVSDYTGFPELLDGRVKTLHPKVHAGILAKNSEEHMQELDTQGIAPIDLVVCNLYDFENALREKVSDDNIMEQIDVGGPTMIRAGAKNHARTLVVVDPSDYERAKKCLQESSVEERRWFAAKAFSHTAQYDALISSYFNREELFPEKLVLPLRKKQALRYGENPDQVAALYAQEPASPFSLVNARQLQGKELSFNNYLDLQAAWGIVREFDDPAVAVIKHTNPCGFAVRATPAEALDAAHAADPLSAFGCVIAVNRDVSRAFAQRLKGWFVEAIVAPGFSAGALELLEKKKKLRLLEHNRGESEDKFMVRYVQGGLLLQTPYEFGNVPRFKEVVGTVSAEQKQDLKIACVLAGHVKSNAIILVKDRVAVGVGAGQMSRVDACRIAIEKAGKNVMGSVAASDAFFPFPDGVEVLAKAGVTAIAQPGGSIRDEEVLKRARELGVSMVLTGKRVFKH